MKRRASRDRVKRGSKSGHPIMIQPIYLLTVYTTVRNRNSSSSSRVRILFTKRCAASYSLDLTGPVRLFFFPLKSIEWGKGRAIYRERQRLYHNHNREQVECRERGVPQHSTLQQMNGGKRPTFEWPYRCQIRRHNRTPRPALFLPEIPAIYVYRQLSCVTRQTHCIKKEKRSGSGGGS